MSTLETERQPLVEGGIVPAHDPEAAASPRLQRGFTAGSLDRTGPLSLETVTSMQGIEALKEEYDRLNRVTGNGVPFALRGWHLSWCTQWLNCNPRVQDDLAVHVMRDRTGLCAAIVPMLRSVRAFGPFQVCSFNMLGPDPALSEVHPSLVEPGFEAPAAAAIQQYLAATPDWDWVNWSGLSPEFAQALGRHAKLAWLEPQRGYLIDLPPTWEQLRTPQAQHSRVPAPLLQLPEARRARIWPGDPYGRRGDRGGARALFRAACDACPAWRCRLAP